MLPIVFFFFLINLILGITMNFGISIRLNPKRSPIICYHIKHSIKKEKNNKKT